ncbi:MAG: hypothetical protein IV094_16155 [Vitreoscilla sp.]|nr:hypothetical protein [Vitreoscilla sp.]
MTRHLLALALALASTLAQAAPISYWKLDLLHSFDDGPGGHHPHGGLVESPAGVFWGTTNDGGADGGAGTVYKFVPGSAPVVMRTFYADNELGAHPSAGLLADGSMFYGTTSQGGYPDMGTVFRISADGQFAMMHEMDGLDGRRPYAPLARGADGALYGGNFYGGANDLGTLFRMDASGAFTVLHAFQPLRSGNDGAHPEGRLVQHKNGFFYGTSLGGIHGAGSVFRISPTGAFTSLHSFQGGSSANGCEPRTGLALDAAGNFVGTNRLCGSANGGTLFSLTASGTAGLMHTFDNSVVYGSDPSGDLIRRSDGRFYGVTRGGSPGCGSVYAKSPGLSGTYTRLFSFPVDRSKGCFPRGRLTSAADGALYGTTELGGAFDKGTIFRLRKVSNYPDH